MSFSDGLSQALGIRVGVSLMNTEEIRPILRKRLLANIVFALSFLYCLFISFSLKRNVPTKHIFVSWLDQNMWFVLLEKKFGLYAHNPWMFSYVAFFIAVVVTTFMIFLNAHASWRSTRSFFHLSRIGFAVVTISYSFLMYSITYDILYYVFGNVCLRFVGVLCFNFASTADTFAMWSVIVYLFRSLYVLRPEERGTIVFFGQVITDLFGGLYLIPTLPAPHFICVMCNYAFDMIPVLWDVYHHPDGRERAVRNYHVIHPTDR